MFVPGSQSVIPHRKLLFNNCQIVLCRNQLFYMVVLLDGKAGQGILNKDPTVRLDGAWVRPPLSSIFKYIKKLKSTDSTSMIYNMSTKLFCNGNCQIVLYKEAYSSFWARRSDGAQCYKTSYVCNLLFFVVMAIWKVLHLRVTRKF